VAGLSGAGQRALLRVLFGDLPMRGGAIRLGGRPWHPRSPAASWRGGVAYVPRERRSEGLVVTRPILENVTLPHLRRFSRGGAFLDRGRERHDVMRVADDVRLRARGPTQPARELSGGNQQKVVFARALAGAPRLLLLDEPTRGVDVGAKFDIYAIIRAMAARGMAVVLVSSDLPELIGMCDRIAVMREGTITAIVPADGMSEEALIGLCYGRIDTADVTPTPTPNPPNAARSSAKSP
jgi:ribose transport system ATP-binding protein